MSQSFECGNTDALVGYLYDECEPEERNAVAAHLATCQSCSSEIAALGGTRRQLSAWTPPRAALGFQMTVPGVAPPLPWWKAPLPAWAQAAAAVVIFGTGLTIGLTRGPAPAAAVNTPAQTAQSEPVADAASRDDLSQLETRLRSEMAQTRTTTPSAVTRTSASDAEIMQKVQALVEQSEERQRRDFTLRSVEMSREFETQRRVDLASVRETLGQLQGVTGAEIRQQREAIDRINSFITVSQQGR